MSKSETDAVVRATRHHDSELHAAPVHTNGAKKSATISNFKEAWVPPSTASHSNGRPHILFAREAAPISATAAVKPVKKTEYKAKFRPFSAYVYVSGNGFKKPKNVDKANGEQVGEWYTEVVERGRKAVEFRSRSQYGHPIAGAGGLEDIYEKSSDGLWVQKKDRPRDMSALALATTQMKIADIRAEREARSRSVSPVKSGGTSRAGSKGVLRFSPKFSNNSNF